VLWCIQQPGQQQLMHTLSLLCLTVWLLLGQLGCNMVDSALVSISETASLLVPEHV
jgi:hypothetical protein